MSAHEWRTRPRFWWETDPTLAANRFLWAKHWRTHGTHHPDAPPDARAQIESLLSPPPKDTP